MPFAAFVTTSVSNQESRNVLYGLSIFVALAIEFCGFSDARF